MDEVNGLPDTLSQAEPQQAQQEQQQQPALSPPDPTFQPSQAPSFQPNLPTPGTAPLGDLGAFNGSYSPTQALANEQSAAAADTFKAFIKAPWLATVGAADTISQSVGLTSKDTITNWLGDDQYREYGDIYRGIGDVAMSVAGPMAITKILRAPAIVEGVASLIGREAAGWLTPAADNIADIRAAYSSQVADLASKGVSDFGSNFELQQMGSAIKYASLQNAVNSTVIAASFTGVAQNQSQLLFPDGIDAHSMLSFIGLTGAGEGLASYLVATAAIRIEKGAAAAEVQAYRESANITPTASMVGQRGPDLAGKGLAARTTGEQWEQASQGRFDAAAVDRSNSVMNKELNGAITAAADDAPIQDLTRPSALAPEQLSRINGQVQASPQVFGSTISIEPITPYEQYAAQRTETATRLSDKVAVLTAAGKQSTAEVETLKSQLSDTLAAHSLALTPTGEIIPHADYELMAIDSPGAIKSHVNTTTSEIGYAYVPEDVQLASAAKGDIVSQGLIPAISPTADGVSFARATGLQQAGVKAVEELLPHIEHAASNGYYLINLLAPEAKDSHLTWDLASRFVELAGPPGSARQQSALAVVARPFGINTAADLAHAATMQKAQAFTDDLRAGLRGSTQHAYITPVMPPMTQESPYTLGMRYNLPLADEAGNSTPLGVYLTSIAHQGAFDFASNFADTAAFQTAIKASQGLPANGPDIITAGKALSSVQGAANQLLIRGVRPANVISNLNTGTLANMVVQDTRNNLLSATGLVNAAKPAMPSAPDFVTKQSNLLASMAGLTSRFRDLLLQAVSGTNIEGVLQQFATRDATIRNSPWAKVAATIGDTLRSVGIGEREAFIAQAAMTMKRLDQPETQHDLVAFNNYLVANQLGFETTQRAPGALNVMLKIDPASKGHTAANLAILQRLLPDVDPATIRALPDPTLLQRGLYQPFAMTQSAAQVVDTVFNPAMAHILEQENAIRYVAKQRLKDPLPNYVPHADLPGQEMGFVKDKDGRIVYIVHGKDADDAAANARKILADRVAQNGDQGEYVISRNNLQQYMESQQELVFNRLTGQSTAQLSTDASRGEYGLAMPVFSDSTLVNSMLRHMDLRVQNVQQQAARLWFQSELGYVNTLGGLFDNSKAIVTTSAGENVRKFGDTASLLQDALLGQRTPNQGALASKVSDALSTTANSIKAGIERAWQYNAGRLNAIFGRIPSQMSPQDFTALSTKLQAEIGYAPFTKAADLMQMDRSKSVEELLHSLNGMTSYMMLRLGELAHPMLLLTSHVPLMLGEMAMMRPTASETAAQFARRQPYASLIQTQKGGWLPSEAVGLAKTVGLMNTQEGRDIVSMGEKFGAFGASTRDVSRFWTSPLPSSPGVWAKTFGDNGWFTRPTDYTEGLIHRMAYVNGVREARASGIQMSEDMQHAFGLQMLHRSLANTSPLNKPEVFQGIAGIPFGLFQTFITNHMENWLQTIENKALRAGLIRYASQFAMFGAESVPGYNQVHDYVMRSYDGSKTVDQFITDKFGGAAGDAILHGPLWQLPKLFGGDGIGVYTRGDSNWRSHLGANLMPNPMDIPSVQMITKVASGLGQLWQANTAPGANMARNWEILTHAMPNRPLSGLMRVLAGYSVNSQGNIIDANTREYWHAFSYLIGSQPETAQQIGALLAQETSIDQIDRVRQRTIEANLKAAIRVNGSVDPAVVTQVMQSWVQNGIAPRDLQRTFLNVALQAQKNTALQRAYKELTLHPDSVTAQEIIRIMGQQG